MARILLISGKGGVGKTTVAAATGLACARRGHRTLVLSFDLAHSLSDSFDLDEALFNERQGLPVAVTEGLEIQEIDVQGELERHWKEIYQYSASWMIGGGLDEVVAEEVAIMPGMEDIVALITLNQYVLEKTYDVIVVDCPPTSEALRFVSISTTLDWYVRKRLKVDRKIAKVVRPMAGMISESAKLYMPQDSYFDALAALFDKLAGVEARLRDPSVTTVRLVTNPEKMVIRETQRAFMYFCMYGVRVDTIVINRMLPADVAYFGDWARSQARYSEDIREYFDPVPVHTLPLLGNEVVGLEQLERIVELLHPDLDPAEVRVDTSPYGFAKEADGTYSLEIPLPFAAKEHIDISRQRDDLIVRVGSFKRNIMLPRAIASLPATRAAMVDDRVVVKFTPESS